MNSEKNPKKLIDSDVVLVSNSSDYGSRGASWAPEFVKYMISIVTHPVYAGMPDAIKEDGKIQWEAPTNRASGKYQFTNQRRKEWWQKKAIESGVTVNSDKWISKTAKLIHPTGEKACKSCGKTLRIAYAYPKKNLIRRISVVLGDDFEYSYFDTITEIIEKAYDLFGPTSISLFRKILSTPSVTIPDFGTNLDLFLLWIEDEYIPNEPSLLSPGAMANPPDRFDGFHSFNLCCRGSADPGRSNDNLKTYSTDRRVFEFWSDGDWIASDRLMSLIKTVFKNERNADGGAGAPSPDHIGPLSLGFCHSPQFRLLSQGANSAKNNRMTFMDVFDLLQFEQNNIEIVSWYAKPLWDLRKKSVSDEEKALRLSKMLRDNQRNAMLLLSQVFEIKAFTFLAYLLNLHFADHKIEFENLYIENFITKYTSILKVNRTTKYANEQKARRMRIGFEALRSYREKENRHIIVHQEDSLNSTIKALENLLNNEAQLFEEMNAAIDTTFYPLVGAISENSIRIIVSKIPSDKIQVFEKAKLLLQEHMTLVAHSISNMWNDDRYVRESFELD